MLRGGGHRQAPAQPPLPAGRDEGGGQPPQAPGEDGLPPPELRQPLRPLEAPEPGGEERILLRFRDQRLVSGVSKFREFS